MLGKKLLTLSCAAGILASGACFLPPLPERRPQLAPASIYLAGMPNIRVTVRSNSPTSRISASRLATAIASSLTEKGRQYAMEAHAGDAPGNEVAVLEVTVFSDMVSPMEGTSSTRHPQWFIAVESSATLTRKDGTVAWQQARSTQPFNYKLDSPFEGDIAADPHFQGWLERAFTDRLVDRIFLRQ
jgi:hypothetical protein